ncbi:MAG: lasso RiPP family leader peptide-containing protein [Methanobacteriaceae archaeon]|nr:lasso RiPP family leader peptide-containing protein [Methanobacteriaceae archaeon]
MKEKKLSYNKPKLIEHGKIEQLTMGSGDIDSENSRFDF